MPLHTDNQVVKMEEVLVHELLDPMAEKIFEQGPRQSSRLRAGSPWTPETTEKFKRLRTGGMPYKQIAVELGIPQTAVQKRAELLGLTKRNQSKLASQEQSQVPKPTAENRLQDACFEAFFRKAEQIGLTVVADQPADGSVWIRIRPSTSPFAKWLLKSGLGEKPYNGESGVDISVVSAAGAGNYPRKITQGEAMVAFFKEAGIENCELMTKPHVHRGIDLDKVDPFKPREKSRKEKAKKEKAKKVVIIDNAT